MSVSLNRHVVDVVVSSEDDVTCFTRLIIPLSLLCFAACSFNQHISSSSSPQAGKLHLINILTFSPAFPLLVDVCTLA